MAFDFEKVMFATCKGLGGTPYLGMNARAEYGAKRLKLWITREKLWINWSGWGKLVRLFEE
jgi:hypothetical protein